MDIGKLGYTNKLFILPFDHRSSFSKGLLGKEENELSDEDKDFIRSRKKLIYTAFKNAILEGVPKEEAAILVDEEYGQDVIRDAVYNNYITLLTTEKSGQKEFTFQYVDFEKHIDKFKPDFTKALIRYNPEDSDLSKHNQQQELKRLSDFCHRNGYKFLLEPLVSATEKQLAAANGSQDKYINSQRPFLTAEAIKELQSGGVEPDVWKLEGTKNSEGYKELVKAAQRDGRSNVKLVILGGGKDLATVEKWLNLAAKVEGVIGFAVGRTVFWEPIINLKEGKISEEEAIAQITKNFMHFYKLFIVAKT